VSFDSIDDARFVPGTILADRYRIVGLLGKGGMGEVYRADDLKLGQPVALKFLPEHLLSDGAALARFHREVRVARQVSHKNVCRVYDIGEVDGRHFLSMEFIKGEELSSLMRRIGRLPHDKAIQIARQMCAGLAAAHDVGFLHRDLKPANIMIDGDGNARILDFGLAGLADEFGEEEVRAGTPAYMSPEQIEGKEQTVQSDIYSLGLVLYELFTGKRAFEASSLHELIKLRRSDTTPTTPSEIVKDLDPTIERVIDRCLQKKPADRPASALQVAAALPGGDPIAAALAAGETPSPEMVAASPKEGALRPVIAVTLLASFIVLIGLSAWLSKYTALYRLTPLEKSPEVLRERAREIISRAGYAERPLDSAEGMLAKFDYLRYIANQDRSPTRWEQLRSGNPGGYRFWYRQSPRYLVSREDVDDRTPPIDVSGMTNLYLDMSGRLHYFVRVPPQTDSAQKTTSEPDWSYLFQSAGLNLSNFNEVTSTWVPPHEADIRKAWEGTDPAKPELRIRVEAASFGGKPVYFETIYPWDRPHRQEQGQGIMSDRVMAYVIITVFTLMIVGGALLALRNIRLGRGDHRGAFRLAVFYFVLQMLVLIFDAHHTPVPRAEMNLVIQHLAIALFTAAFMWLVYIALEPLVRRRWPHRIISWTRLLAGGWRDPLVGRDTLVGAVAGAGAILAINLAILTPRWIGLPQAFPETPDTPSLGIAHFALKFVTQVNASVALSFAFLFLLLLFFVVLRREVLAAVALFLLVAALIALNLGAAGLPFVLIFALLEVGVLYRYGLLAMVATHFIVHLWVFYPVTTELGAWYATDFVLALIIVIAVVIHGFFRSLAGQSVFAGKLLAD
jgi:serine/threonine protein kinase